MGPKKKINSIGSLISGSKRGGSEKGHSPCPLGRPRVARDGYKGGSLAKRQRDAKNGHDAGKMEDVAQVCVDEGASCADGKAGWENKGIEEILFLSNLGHLLGLDLNWG